MMTTSRMLPAHAFWLAVLWALLPRTVRAQHLFAGTVEYERKVNLYRLYESNEWFAREKDEMPRFREAHFELSFTEAAALYKPGHDPETSAKGNDWFNGTPAPQNTVYTDFKAGRVRALKTIFEEKFLIEDSLRQMAWRLTGELRIIAGYPCRKAVGRICDSVYVVAFYTDAIPLSGGPESFGGLPGLILELAVPRLYTTWTATKVDATAPKPLSFAPGGKAKKTTSALLAPELVATFKDWGKEKEQYLWWCLL